MRFSAPLDRLSSGQIVVPVILESGAMLDFVVDSGASLTVISPDTRARVQGEDQEFIPAAGAAGEISGARLFSVNALQLGAMVLKSHLTGVLDLSSVERRVGRQLGGGLGRNFLRAVDLAIDFQRRRIMFDRAGTLVKELAAPWGLVPHRLEELDAGLSALRLMAGDVELLAVFDLGASKTMFNEVAAEALNLVEVVGRSGQAMGADGRILRPKTVEGPALALSETTLQAPRAEVGDLPVFEVLALMDTPALVLGLDVLADRRMILASGAGRLYLRAARGS